MPALPRRFARNVLTTYAYSATSGLLALVMTPVFVNALGKEGYGIWILVGSIAVYFDILEFGFGAATIKQVAHYAALDDERALRKVVSTSFWILSVLGCLALAVGCVLAALFPTIFGVSPELQGAAALLVVLVTVNLAVSIPSDTFGGVLFGLQRYDLINLTLIAVAVLQAGAWAVTIAVGGGLVALGAVTMVIGLAGQLARYLLARRLVPGLSPSPRFFERRMTRSLASLSVWYSVVDLSALVIVRLDPLVVGLVISVQAAGVFAVGQKLTLVIEQLVHATTKVFFPHSSELAALGDRTGLRSALVLGSRLSLAVAAPLSLAVAFFAGPLIEGWVGDGFADAGTVAAILAAAMVVNAVTGARSSCPRHRRHAPDRAALRGRGGVQRAPERGPRARPRHGGCRSGHARRRSRRGVGILPADTSVVRWTSH